MPTNCARVGTTPSARNPIIGAEDWHQSWESCRAAAAERDDGMGEQVDGQRSGYSALNDRLQKIFEQALLRQTGYAVDEKIDAAAQNDD